MSDTKKAKKPEYEYEGEAHLPGEKNPRKIKLTKEDLDPKNDPVLAPLFAIMDGSMGEYNRMPVIRDLQHALKSKKKDLTEQFIRYKKIGRIPALADLNKK